MSGLDRLPPQQLEFEEAVLGAVMVDRESLDSMKELINDENVFYKSSHQTLYKAICSLNESGSAVDLLTVVHQLRKTKMLDQVGGVATLTQLTDRFSSASNVREYILVLLEAYMRRIVIEASNKMGNQAYQPDNDVFKILDNCQQALDRIRHGLRLSDTQTGTQVFSEALQKIRKGMDNKGMTGIPTGLKSVDDLLGGWQTALYILAARPKMGKTANVIAWVKAAAQAGEPVVIFSLEMKATELMNRIISMCVYEATRAIITPSELMRGEITEDQYQMIQYVMKKYNLHLIYIDDQSNLSIQEFRSKCIRLKSKHGIKMAIVDYLQLMQGEKGGNREQEIGSISRGLKNLSKDLDIPVIALSQLSREVEKRADKKPMLSDLRESGSIEQDANVVMFLFRPEYYGITEDEDGISTKNTAELIVAANRNGPTDNIPFYYNPMVNVIRDCDGYVPKSSDSLSLLPKSNSDFYGATLTNWK